MSGVVHLVRHGEVFNPDGVLYGRIPGFGLSDAGEQMARDAGAWLKGRDVAVVVASPLERAVQTATFIADILGLPVTTDERLIESDNVFEGKKLAGPDSVLKDPRQWRHFWNPIRPSWGEPYEQVASRMLAAVTDAHIAAGDREAVCVSHQLPIYITRLKVEGRRLWHRPDRRECALASVTTIGWSATQPVFSGYDEPAGEAGRRKGVPGA